MLIKVTQEDIDQGIPKNALYCPISRALQRHFNKPLYVCVGGKYDAYITPNFSKYKQRGVCMTEAMYKFTQNFDTNKSVYPRTFRFNPHPSWDKFKIGK